MEIMKHAYDSALDLCLGERSKAYAALVGEAVSPASETGA